MILQNLVYTFKKSWSASQEISVCILEILVCMILEILVCTCKSWSVRSALKKILVRRPFSRMQTRITMNADQSLQIQTKIVLDTDHVNQLENADQIF